MQLSFFVQGKNFSIDTKKGFSLASGLDFNGPQINHFGVPAAKATTIEMGGFVGDTARGGSCNVKTLEIIPHCHGTHTESVSHIVDELIKPSNCVSSLLPARLISVTPVAASQTADSYEPELTETDRIIDKKTLELALADTPSDWCEALLIRTLPNDSDKLSRHYSSEQEPPFFSHEAMTFINEKGVQHLLVDFPSLDRQYDEGKLSNHRLYWSVESSEHNLSETTQSLKTVTELIFVNDEIQDGVYVLNLQLIDFEVDAVPSRPLLYPVSSID